MRSQTERDSASALARRDLEGIRRYPSRVAADIDLSDNTNKWGTPPHAAEVLRQGTDVARYPNVFGERLKHAVAEVAAVSPHCVVTGCGSDDVIECAIRAFSTPGDTIAYPDPSFGMLRFFSRINHLVPAPVPLNKDRTLDVDAMLATRARITYICAPHNPTGLGISQSALDEIVRDATGLVIVDEAYIDFTGSKGMLSASGRMNRVLVTRTFSKACGLAGLRVGYGVASASIIDSIEKVRGPFKLNTIAELAAVAALTLDARWIATTAKKAVGIRHRFVKELEAIGFIPLPSETNFLLVPVDQPVVLAARLHERGITIRALPGLPGIGNAVRITVGPWPWMKRILCEMAHFSRRSSTSTSG